MLLTLQHIQDRIAGKAPAGAKRSSGWSKVRKAHLDLFPTCAVCGGKEKLEVHHLKSFHEHPELEEDMTNLITLCESGHNGINCHLFCGHRGSFQSINETAVDDAAYWNKKITTR